MYQTTITTRMNDYDYLGHINNAVYATYAEEVRKEFFGHHLGVDLTKYTGVVAENKLNYFKECRMPTEKIDVRVEVLAVQMEKSRLRFTFVDHFRPEKVYATVETIQITKDIASRQKAVLPVSVMHKLHAMVEEHDQRVVNEAIA